MQLHCILNEERLVVPKKLLACNTKLNYMTDSLAIVKMKLRSSIRTSIDKLKPFFVRLHSFLTCVVPVFPLTLLLYPSFTPVKIVAYDL